MKRRLLFLSIPGFGLFLLVAPWLAGSILSYPSRRYVGSVPSDLSGRSVQFVSASGATLSGWLLPGRQNAGAVVLMHGVRENRLVMLPRARLLAREGYTVLLFDFQAHGESPGEQITFGYLESRDALAAVDFLRRHEPEEKIGVIGTSLGGASALLAASPLDVTALVIESVYPSIEQAVADRLKARMGNWAGAITPLLTGQFKMRMGFGPEALRPIDQVGTIKTPKLFIAGTADAHTTIEESRQMFAVAAEPKQLWEVEGAPHVDLYKFAGAQYEQRVLAFLKQHLRNNSQ